MNRHTPGPWFVGASKISVLTEHGTMNVPVPPEEMERPSKVKWPIAEANARLIAAAPDMLAALEDVIDRLDNFVDVVDGPEGQPQPNWAMSLRAELERVVEKAVAR